MRLLTRSDFDGICCAVLLKEIGLMDEMVYAHPKDLQEQSQRRQPSKSIALTAASTITAVQQEAQGAILLQAACYAAH